MARLRIGFFCLCAVVLLLTASGRIAFPDDEIVFQTTASLWDEHDLSISGIPTRSGEPDGRAEGTFGWAEGIDGERYGFFGHGLSIVALPMYALGRASLDHVPATWTALVRGAYPTYFVPTRQALWLRLCVALTNVLLTAATAWVLARWLSTLGCSPPASIATAGAWLFGTLAWPYARTFLSEPLSALCLVAAAAAIARAHRSSDPTGPLIVAAAWAGFSVHVHLLNLLTVPALCLYAGGRVTDRDRRPAAIVLVLAIALLGLGQHLRFGSPWESGRFGHYSSFAWPFEALAAFAVSPGRSLILTSPVVVLGLLGLPELHRRQPAVARFVVLAVILRVGFVACRSDWWGGWAVGPRHLVPLLPLLLVPLPYFFAGVRDRRRRGAAFAIVTLSVLLQLHLSTRDVFEWMLRLRASTGGLPMIDRSHWWPSASPVVGFLSLPVDTLSAGALRLAAVGEPAPLVAFAVLVVGAAFVLARLLRALARATAS